MIANGPKKKKKLFRQDYKKVIQFFSNQKKLMGIN